MKTRILIIIAAFLVLIPWFNGLPFNLNNEVMVDGITVSAGTAMTFTIIFSLLSWFVLSWDVKNIKSTGILLSIITGAALIIPFLNVLGPIAAIVVGIVAGFAAFLLQRYMTHPAQKMYLILGAITIITVYSVLLIMIISVSTTSWDNGDGIDTWSGTPEGMEPSYNTDIRFIYFLVTIPALIITGIVIHVKTKSGIRDMRK